MANPEKKKKVKNLNNNKLKVEKKSKREQDNAQIKELEERISKTKYNKKTQHAIGLYKAKLAALKDKQEKRAGSGTGKSDYGWSVRKSGDASVVLLGFPSVGKSSLLNALTNANSEVGAYTFTTLSCIPGIMNYKGAKIQILDVPGIVKGAAAGTGRGKEVLQVIRNADLVLILLDVFHPEHLKILEKEVFDTKVRLNQKKPDIRIKKTIKNGLQIGSTIKLTKIDTETIKAIFKEFRINNAEVLIRTDVDADQIIDAIEDNRNYIPSLNVINKIDMVEEDYLNKVFSNIDADLGISAEKNINLEELKELIFSRLEFMPIFCKEVSKKADMDEPMIMRENNSVEDVCNKLHKDFKKKFKFARVWGKSAKFPGQKLSLKHKLKQGDVVEIHTS